MKKPFLSSLLFCLFTLFTFSLRAQDVAITADFKKATVARLSDAINERYVFPDVAKATGEHLQKQLSAGVFNKYTDLKAFADALTAEVQSINHDKHMRIRPLPPREAPPDTPERMIEDQLVQQAQMRENNAGFREVKKLDGNIGYLDLRGFASPDWGAPMADAYMKLLATSDAIIIDLRKNGGGSPEMVQYLCSYFFDKHVHLNSLYWREGDETREFWTLDKVGGQKMPEVPLFILTSNYTFSGAEEFSYNMQTQRRATLIGETTGGGANPGGGVPLNDKLMVFIPTGRAINPITKTNWEGVGVVPEVMTTADEALEKGVDLAKEAAEEFRQKNKEKNTVLFKNLTASLENYTANSTHEPVFNSLKKCLDAGLLDEPAINQMGYDYLMQHQKPTTAEVIFKCNTLLFPASANVFDSYGEALATNGKLEESLKSYQKAVELAEASNDPNLPLFKENRKKAAEKAKAGKP
ncbi:MAG: S41 family peptidase [Saprospiraceae bacterium]